jgi:hypothetical protein
MNFNEGNKKIEAYNFFNILEIYFEKISKATTINENPIH